jgi:histidine triad (HIT) family protein
MTSNCIFCQIIAGTAPAEILYRDDQVVAFLDTRPAAPTHILVVPIQHIVSVNELNLKDESLVGHLFTVACQVAAQAGIRKSGYRCIINTGPDSGQAVFHLHLHVLGGRRMHTLTGA